MATVDAAGVVTATAPGETTVTATGKDTKAVGRHALVVVATVSELPPEIAIAGPHGLVVGTTTTLTATTVNGTDASYTWASLDEAVVTVDAAGVVTPVASGETSVTATGADTGAIGRHALVVIPRRHGWSGGALPRQVGELGPRGQDRRGVQALEQR